MPKVTFVGEQQGPAESELKDLLGQRIAGFEEVSKAYLVQVTYGSDPTVHVALAIEGQIKQEHAESIAQFFRKWAALGTNMDLIVLCEEQIPPVRQIAQPFFSR